MSFASIVVKQRRDHDQWFNLPKPVWVFGWVSLATDSATEAVYPLLPFFLTRVLGAGAVSLGIVEGAAEAANSILKIVSGRVADRSARKRPIVLFGYSVSSLARPFIALTTSWMQLFTVRILDRAGKGVRGAPRDAMLATWATPQTRGKVFGFHRAMDHAGAVLGPALASLFLFFYPGHYRTLFALTIIPGAIAVALILLVPENVRAEDRLKPDTTTESRVPTAPDVVSAFSRTSATAAEDVRPRADATNIARGTTVANGTKVAKGTNAADATRDKLPRAFTRFMLVLTLFALGNSTDAFLLLKLTDVAGTTKYVPLMWAALHVVKATVSVVGGGWSDRIGRRPVIAVGWLMYAIVYAGFAVSNTLDMLLSWFLIYGFYFGFAEGAEKALVADLAPESRRGLAFGVYNAVQGVGALAASVLFGVLWSTYGAAAAFGLGAALALAATALLFVVVRRQP